MGRSPLAGDDPRTLGRYRPLARLGAGGMGVVYLAEAPDGRPVAVKVVRPELAREPEFTARFEREVRAALRVRSPNAVRLLDFHLTGAEVGEPLYLVTEYVDGPSLEDLVRTSGPLDLAMQWTLLTGMATALADVHAAGLVHRDLKPSNVLCGPTGPLLIDFGIAAAAEATSLTRTGVVVGSPNWMAPEQIRSASVTPAADVFNLGGLLVYAATGTPPFGYGRTEAVFYRALHEQPDLGEPALMDANVRRVAEDCLSKDPVRRPTAAEIRAWSGGLPGPAEDGPSTWVVPAGLGAGPARASGPGSRPVADPRTSGSGGPGGRSAGRGTPSPSLGTPPPRDGSGATPPPAAPRHGRRVATVAAVFLACAAVAVGGYFAARGHGGTAAATPPPVVTTTSASAPVAVTTTGPPPAPTTAPSPTPAVSYEEMAGTFYTHGGAFDVDGNGAVHMTRRTYTDCADGAPSPCDTVQGDEIVDGYHATGRLDPVQQDNGDLVSTLTVGTSNDPLLVAGARYPVRVTAQDILSVGSLDFRFCGPDAPTDACGA